MSLGCLSSNKDHKCCKISVLKTGNRYFPLLFQPDFSNFQFCQYNIDSFQTFHDYYLRSIPSLNEMACNITCWFSRNHTLKILNGRNFVVLLVTIIYRLVTTAYSNIMPRHSWCSSTINRILNTKKWTIRNCLSQLNFLNIFCSSF